MLTKCTYQHNIRDSLFKMGAEDTFNLKLV